MKNLKTSKKYCTGKYISINRKKDKYASEQIPEAALLCRANQRILCLMRVLRSLRCKTKAIPKRIAFVLARNGTATASFNKL